MYLLPHKQDDIVFPPVADATPEGLLAIGGDLQTHRLLEAYRRGIFPWYSSGQPILWWSPDPRVILYPGAFHVSRSLRKTLGKNVMQVTLDRCFSDVIQACARPRSDDPGSGTWITPEMITAYCELHQQGYAHSVETWCDGQLVGGLYGVSLGRAFFGESMFSHRSDASKVALAYLVAQTRHWGFDFIDCQLPSDHLRKLGAEQVDRDRFIKELGQTLSQPDRRGRWQLDPDLELV